MEKFQRDNSIFKEVDEKASIADVIAYELGSNALIKKGKDYKCLCPFHHDHSPSMQINTTRNTFKCWVDGEGGGPIHFVKKYEHISYLEALKKVCQICNIPLPISLNGQTNYTPRMEQEFKKELEALTELKRFYQTYLQTKEGEICRKYLEKRNIPQEAIEHFGIGYAPSDPKIAIEALRKLGFDVPTLERAGILSNSSELADRYSSRLMYPIEDNYGHVVGFSGRKISDEQPGGKYINYPATRLFEKKNILYHYHIAKTVAKKYGFVYVVEGFNDVIAFCRADINSVVGTMGTALTKENALALKKLDVEIRICLDNDEPGQKASEDLMAILNEIDANFVVVRQFKGGKDADEVLANFKEKGTEELNKEVSRFYDPFLFLLARALKTKGTNNKLTNSNDIEEFINKAKPYYAKLNAISKETDIKHLSNVTGVEIPTLKSLLTSSNITTEEKAVQIQEENTNSPIKENKQKYPTSYQNNRKYNKQNPFSPRTNEQVIYVEEKNLPKNKNVAKTLTEFVQLTKNTTQGSHMDFDLIKSECGIIYVLPHSRDAFILFNDSRCDLRFKSFDILSKIIYEVYSSNPNKPTFDEKDYQYLKDFITNYKIKHQQYLDNIEKTTSEKENFDFDIDGIDLDGIDLDDFENESSSKSNNLFSLEINDEELYFLTSAIEFIQRSKDSVYKTEYLEKELKAHPLLLKYDNRLHDCYKENINVKQDKQLMELRIQLKRQNYQKKLP